MMAENFQIVDAKSAYNPHVLVGVGLTLTIIPTAVVALRFFTRWHYSIGYGHDDWTIVAALVLCIGAGIIVILSATIGRMGLHQDLGAAGQLIHTDALYNYEKLRYSNTIVTTTNLGVVKISILLYYRRLFVTKAFRIVSMAMLIFLIAWTIAFASAMAAQCTPASDFWNLFEVDYPSDCVQVRALYLILAWFDLALDIVVLALPIPVVLFLQMPWRRKIAVLDALLLGIVVLGSGIARLIVFLKAIHEADGNPIGYFHDTPWWTAGTLFWTFAENSIAIVGACLPTLAPLWTRRTKKSSVDHASNSIDSMSSTTMIEKIRTKISSSRTSESHNSSAVRSLHFNPETSQHSTQIFAETAIDQDQPINGIRVDQTFRIDRV